MKKLGEFESVENRKQMIDCFDGLMTSTFNSIKKDRTQEFGENLIKSFILELHTNGKETKNFFDFLHFLESENYKIKEIKSENIFIIYKTDFLFFLDSFDIRFLLLHTPSKAEFCSEHINSMIKKFPLLDRTWFSSNFLERLSYYGEFESWKTVFNSKMVFKETELSSYENLEWEELHLAIKTRNTRDKLKQIRRSGIFKGIMPLTSIRIRKKGDDEYFAREDISFMGKFTARGNNFKDHLDILTQFSRTSVAL
jgi:hypothetical protein